MTLTTAAPSHSGRRSCLACRWIAALLACVMLAACGGGSGSDDANGGTAEPSSDSAREIASALPSAKRPGKLSGRLWHNNYALDYIDGTQIASPTGKAPVFVSGNLDAIPWPDGKRYVTYEWDVSSDTTLVEIRDLASGVRRAAVTVDGYFRSLQPSPADESIVIGRFSDSPGTAGIALAIDVAAARALWNAPSVDDAVTWMPDGRLLRVTSRGAIVLATLKGNSRTIGRLKLPRSTNVTGAWVNPQGNQMALRLVTGGASSIDRTDIWIADIHGKRLERFTKTGLSSYARWSPDGKEIGFDVDTGSVCGATGCIGQCDLWFAPSTSRNIRALKGSNDAWPFKVNDRQGNASTLGCELTAWTR